MLLNLKCLTFSGTLCGFDFCSTGPSIKLGFKGVSDFASMPSVAAFKGLATEVSIPKKSSKLFLLRSSWLF